jgi:hypothetical protein
MLRDAFSVAQTGIRNQSATELERAPVQWTTLDLKLRDCQDTSEDVPDLGLV